MDIILYNILVALVCLIFGYLMGSIEFSIIIGKVFFHQDPRDFGSGNAGGTNAGRLWGKKVGLTVIILDMIKTIIPMWIMWALLTFIPFGDKPLVASTTIYFSTEVSNYVIQWPVYLLANLGAIFGHCWPCFNNFKGGKGVSAFMGTILAASWGLGWALGIFYFLFLKKTKMVSLTSILMGCFVSLVTWIWVILVMTHVIPHGYEWIVCYGDTINVSSFVYAIVITIMSGLMIWRHKANIQRLKAGTERKITWMDSKKEKAARKAAEEQANKKAEKATEAKSE